MSEDAKKLPISLFCKLRCRARTKCRSLRHGKFVYIRMRGGGETPVKHGSSISFDTTDEGSNFQWRDLKSQWQTTVDTVSLDKIWWRMALNVYNLNYLETNLLSLEKLTIFGNMRAVSRRLAVNNWLTDLPTTTSRTRPLLEVKYDYWRSYMDGSLWTTYAIHGSGVAQHEFPWIQTYD